MDFMVSQPDPTETRLGALAGDLVAHGVVIHGPDGAIRWSNAAAAAILGLTSDQLWGRHPVDPRWRAMHEDGSPWPGENHPAMETLRTGEPVTDAVMGIHRPDDNVNWLRVATRTVVLPDNTVGVLATFTDITDLRCLAADHRLVFEYSETPAIVVEYGSRTIIDVNRSLCRWLGFLRNELLGTHVHALIDPADFEIGSAGWKQLLRNGLVEREAHYRHRDGTTRCGRMTARAFPHDGNRPDRILAQAVDITARTSAPVAAVDDVRAASSNKYEALTPRQRQVFDLLAAGLPSKSIGRELDMKVNTVRNHVQNILTKLDVHSRLEAIAAIRTGD